MNVLFDKKNGLAPGKFYQLVLSGVAMDEAVRNGEYVHVFTTDDVDLHPYLALERGIAPLYRSPQEPLLAALSYICSRCRYELLEYDDIDIHHMI